MKGEHIITAWAENPYGLGWTSSPVWYITQNQNGVIRLEAVQPADHTREMSVLFPVSSLAHSQMTKAVREYLQAQQEQRS